MLFPSDADSSVLDSGTRRTAAALLENTARMDQGNQDESDAGYYDTEYIASPALYKDFSAQISYAISEMNFETSVFLAEMYYTECLGLPVSNMNRLQSVYLYSLSLYMDGQYDTAAEVAERYKSRHVAIAYIYARTCLKLDRNEENACLYLVIHLEEFAKNERRDREMFYNMPSLATIHCVIGKLYRRADNTKSSITHHLEALKSDAYLWESFTELCSMKAVVNIKTLFNMDHDESSGGVAAAAAAASVGSDRDTGMSALRTDLTKQLNNTASAPNSQRGERQHDDKARTSDSRLLLSGSLSPFRTMANKGKPSRDGGSRDANQPPTLDPNQMFMSITGNTKRGVHSGPLLNQYRQNPLFSDNSAQGKSSRTRSNNDAAYSPSVEQPTISSLAKKNNATPSSVRVIIKNRILTTPPAKMAGDQRTTFKTPRNISNMNSMGGNTSRKLVVGQNSGSAVSSLGMVSARHNRSMGDNLTPPVSQEFKRMVYAFYRILKASSQYNSYNAIRVINRELPSHICNNMPWCQAQLAKLHFEIVNYDMSLLYFMNLRRIQATRLKDLEIFSTLLWHQSDKVKLSNLSSELIDAFPDKPQTWCVLGNYFSLQKDHEEAIKAFEKATTLNPRFSYAYTLQGHEYASNESFDIAKEFYMKALACDPQHYNAYYGMGSCASQMGKFEEALLYFEKARIINPVNVVLICCCGTELEKLYHNEMALKYYELACKLDPRSVLAKYRRAELLFTMNRYSVALGQFEELIRLDSENPNLHFMLGKILETLGRKKDAIREYTIALHLDPKGNQFVIEALENCHMQD